MSSQPLRDQTLGQGEDRTTQAPMSRFRPQFRQLTIEEKTLHDEIKAKAVEMETLIGKIVPDNSVISGTALRYRALAMTALEESVMWAVKGLTA